MTYDLMNRRMNRTHHHTSITGSTASIDRYIHRGVDASKMGLGIAFYAKYFTTSEGEDCAYVESYWGISHDKFVRWVGFPALFFTPMATCRHLQEFAS